MAAVVGRCYTAATRSIVATSVVDLHDDHTNMFIYTLKRKSTTSPSAIT